MVDDSHRQTAGAAARGRTLDRVIFSARKSETQLVWIVLNGLAAPRISVPVGIVTVRNKIDPSLRDVTARGNQLNLIGGRNERQHARAGRRKLDADSLVPGRSEEHTSELQSQS